MKTRNHNRAKGQTTMTLPMSEWLKNTIKELAKLDDRPAATWVRRVITENVKRSLAQRKKTCAAA